MVWKEEKELAKLKEYENASDEGLRFVSREKSICIVQTRIHDKQNSIIMKQLSCLVTLLNMESAKQYPFKVSILLGLYQ